MGEAEEVSAAIGIGSNSTRLVVARGSGTAMEAVERAQVVTRLAGYATGPGGAALLNDRALRDTVEAAARFAARAREMQATLAGVLATEAVRAAADGARLVRTLEEELGLQVRVISGEEEAALGWRAVAPLYAGGDMPVGVIDVGGGSTDLSTGLPGETRPQAALSLKVGGRTAMKRYDLHKPVELSKMVGIINSLRIEMHDAAAAVEPRPKAGVVIGGTAEVIAAAYGVLEGTPANEETLLDRDWLARAVLRMAGLTIEGRVEMGVPEDRADIAVAGGTILLVVLDAWGLQKFRVSERGILDGFLMGLEMRD